MGIKQLMQLINEKASNAVRLLPLERYSGQIVACDASMAMYQFLIATQFSSKQGVSFDLTDSEGNQTGHLLGLFNRTVMFIECGIKPIWVFDGKPPVMKSGELEKRKKAKEQAKEQMELAQEEGKLEEVVKFKQRTVSLTTGMQQDAQDMLRLMGVPVVLAPCEAEAQCAFLVKSGRAHAVASEDMDSLTHGSAYLLRGFNSKKEPIKEISLEDVLGALALTQDEFIDLCILLGCDYTEHIEGVGPVTAFKLISQHRDLERVMQAIHSHPKKKYRVIGEFNYQGAREMFRNPEVSESQGELKWTQPDTEAMNRFLVEQKGFSAARVETGVKKLILAHKKPTQMTMETFFGKPLVSKRKPPSPASNKKLKGNRRK